MYLLMRKRSVVARWLGLVLMVLVSAGAQAYTEEELGELIAGREAEISEIEASIARLNTFIAAYPANKTRLEDTIIQLQEMDDHLQEIQQSNLIKLLFRLSFEVYNTISLVANTATSSIAAMSTMGTRFAAGVAGISLASDALANVIGGGATPRTANIAALDETVSLQIGKVGRIQLLLGKSLQY